MATKKRPRPIEEPAEGYPEEIFLNMQDVEKQDYQCNICLQILRQPVFCENIHFFCSSCLKRWKDSPKNVDVLDFEPPLDGEPAPGTACPVCRTVGPYTEDDEMTKIIARMEVFCIEDKCKWAGDLASYDDHFNTKHKIREPSPRRLRSGTSKTKRVTYHY